MKLLNWISVALLAGATVGEAKPPKKPKHQKEFSNRVIFTPPKGSRASYPRVVELSDGTILATVSWRDPKASKAYFPIYESKDHGWTWTHISNVTDDVSVDLEKTCAMGLFTPPRLTVSACGRSRLCTN